MNLWGLIPLISCLTFTALFILVLQQARRRVDKVFALFLFASGVWSLTSFMLVFNPSASSQYLIFWNELVITAIPWVVVSYYHFVRAYNNKPGGIGLYLGYAFVLTILALGLGGYVVRSATLVDGFLYHEIKPWDYVIASVVVPLLTIIMLVLVRRYRSSTDPIDRNRTMYLMVGWSILVVISYITPFTPALAGLPTDHIGNLINALIIGYAISKFHLLNIRFVIRRGLSYFLLAICISGIYSGVILLGSWLLPNQSLYIILMPAAGLALLLTLLARPVRFGIQEWIDRIFYRETYDYRQILLSFSSKMGNIIDLEQLADVILPAISKALRITQAQLLFEDVNTGEFTTYFTYPETENKSNNEPSFNLDNPIVIWLREETGPLHLNHIDNIPQLKGL